MKKYLVILLFGLWCNSSNAQMFEFEKVFICGPKKMSYDEQHKDRGWYYLIHFDKDERFIVRNNEYNYSSFQDTHYPHIWVQNGKITSAELSKDSKVYFFELISTYVPASINSYKKIRYLNVNFDSMTYVSRAKSINGDGTNKMYDPVIGICWLEWEN